MRSSTIGMNMLRHDARLSPPLLHGSVCGFPARPYRDMECSFSHAVAALVRSSGRQVIQDHANVAEEEIRAGLLPRVPIANARENGGRCRPARVQVRFRVSRQGEGAGKRTTRALIACSFVYLWCIWLAFVFRLRVLVTCLHDLERVAVGLYRCV